MNRPQQFLLRCFAAAIIFEELDFQVKRSLSGRRRGLLYAGWLFAIRQVEPTSNMQALKKIPSDHTLQLMTFNMDYLGIES